MANISRGKKIWLIVIGGIVVVAVATAIIFWPQIISFTSGFFTQNTDTGRAGTTITGTPVVSKTQLLYESAVAAAVKDGPEAGQKVLDDEIAKTSVKEEKSALYIQKSTLVASQDGGADMKTALQYAYEAEAISPDYGTAIFIAESEDAAGNYANAIKYYKLYIERLTPDAVDLNPGDKEYIERRIQQLEAQQ